MDKIFEIRQFTDGGPSDRGDVTGYIRTDKTREQMRKENGHGFTDYFELTEEEYLKRKKHAEKVLAMFNINIGEVRNGSQVEILVDTDGPGGSNNKAGDIGIVDDYCSDSGADGGFRVVVEGRPTYGNWHSIEEVKVLKY